jgi:hypothetical protein
MTKKELDELRDSPTYWKERHALEEGDNDALKAENARLLKALEGVLPLAESMVAGAEECQCEHCAGGRSAIAAAREAMK